MNRVLLSWSSGKDSAWALHLLRRQPGVEVAGLITTINEDADRVAMHAVRHELLRLQAAATDLPLTVVRLPNPCRNDQYQAAMLGAFEAAAGEGVDAVAYGDLYLDDVRRYRESLMAESSLAALFPLWQLGTRALAREMVGAGLRARITCVDPRQLPARFAGRAYDDAFLDELPDNVDPCGENGEFHTFVHAGPMLAHEIAIDVGDTIERDGFLFTDLRPAGGPHEEAKQKGKTDQGEKS